jgi:hexokinase
MAYLCPLRHEKTKNRIGLVTIPRFSNRKLPPRTKKTINFSLCFKQFGKLALLPGNMIVSHNREGADMSFEPRRIADFARLYGFHYELCEPFALIEEFKDQMHKGLRGLPSSLAMIPSYLRPLRHVPRNGQVIALDAGGTNLRAALVKVTETGAIAAGEINKVPMPGTRGRVGGAEFFDQIAAAVTPLLNGTDREVSGIGFCFSYPVEITEDTDGRMLQFSKEVDAPEVVGQFVGRGLRDALARQGMRVPERIVVLNDTVSTLLAGLGSMKSEGWGGPGPALGFILGTGANIAYPETSIPKIGFDDPRAPQVVVLESGNFAWPFRGDLDRRFDQTTKNPGAYTFEKATAGAYLGPLSLMIFKQALSDGLLEFRAALELEALSHLETRDLNAFMHDPLNRENPLAALFSDDEGDAIRTAIYLSWIVVERAGLLNAAALTAVLEHMEAAYDPAVPLRIAVEGTTFVVYQGMRRALESQLHRLLTVKGPRSYSIGTVEQASLFGAAVAAFSA